MYPSLPHFLRRHIHETRHWKDKEKNGGGDPRINDLGRTIQNDFATIRDNYGTMLLIIVPVLANIFQPRRRIQLSLHTGLWALTNYA